MKDKCPFNICNGRKHVPVGDGTWAPCKCLQAEKRKREYEKAGIPKYMFNMKWDDWYEKHSNAKPLQNRINKWSAKVMQGGAKRFACAAGGAGSGKLTLAYLLVRQCIQSGMTAKVVTLTDLLEDRFAEDDAKKYVMDQALSVDFLCVRLGVEEAHKWRASTLERVHFGRKVEGKPTFYTTRYVAGAFEGAYGNVLMGSFWQPKGDVIVWDLSKGRVIVA